MIQYIDAQLAIWGKWAIRKAAKGIGYPCVCPMFRDTPSGAGYGSAPPAGTSIDCIENILDTDAAVQRLSEPDRRLAIEFYQIGGSGVDIARRLGIARQRLYERLHQMHAALLGHLNDVVAGL